MGLRMTRLAILAVAVPLLALAAPAGAAQVDDARKLALQASDLPPSARRMLREEQPG